MYNQSSVTARQNKELLVWIMWSSAKKYYEVKTVRLCLIPWKRGEAHGEMEQEKGIVIKTRS